MATTMCAETQFTYIGQCGRGFQHIGHDGPNGYSTGSRRWRIFSGFSSSRRCTASRPCSCSPHQVILHSTDGTTIDAMKKRKRLARVREVAQRYRVGESLAD